MAGGMAGTEQADTEDQAYGRPCCGNKQGADGGAALFLNTGHPTKQKEGDAPDLHALTECHQGVPQFMEQHRHEQQEGRGKSQGPEQHRPPGQHAERIPEVEAVLLAKGHRGDSQNQEPTGMDPQGNAPNRQQLPTLTQNPVPRSKPNVQMMSATRADGSIHGLRQS